MTTLRNYAVVPQAPSAAGQPAQVIPINTQAANAKVLPLSFACPLASEQVVTNPAVSSSANPIPLVLAVPSKSLVEGQRFEVLISGSLIQPGATPTVGFNLYAGNSMTVANNTLLKAIAAQAVTGGKQPFFITALLTGDTTSGVITGTVKALVGSSLVAEAVLTNALANVNFAQDPVLQLLFSVVPTVANAGNIMRLYEFAANF